MKLLPGNSNFHAGTGSSDIKYQQLGGLVSMYAGGLHQCTPVYYISASQHFDFMCINIYICHTSVYINVLPQHITQVNIHQCIISI